MLFDNTHDSKINIPVIINSWPKMEAILLLLLTTKVLKYTLFMNPYINTSSGSTTKLKMDIQTTPN